MFATNCENHRIIIINSIQFARERKMIYQTVLCMDFFPSLPSLQWVWRYSPCHCHLFALLPHVASTPQPHVHYWILF